MMDSGRAVATVCGAVAGVGLVGLGGVFALRWIGQRCTKTAKKANPYETQLMIDHYIGFHYAPSDQYITFPCVPKDALEFPSRCAALCLKHKVLYLA